MDFIHNLTWPVFYDYIPVYEIWIQFTNVFKSYRPETIFHMEIKGHNSDNWCFISIMELDLYFMIIYLCMKYESNSPMYSKDIARKPFFVQRSRAITLDNNWWILSVIKLDLYFMIIYLCMKYESNTPMYSKHITWKPLFVHTGQDVRDRTYVRTDKGDAICPPPPPPL